MILLANFEANVIFGRTAGSAAFRASVLPPGAASFLAAFTLAALALIAALAIVGFDGPQVEPLGTVHFAISCSPASQQRFDRATALLHSLAPYDAEREYAGIAADEPGCAMAYWGVAMSRLRYPNTPPSAQDMRVAGEAIGAAAAAPVASPRERLYISAAGRLLTPQGPADWHSRAIAYADAMAALARDEPQDREATIFYALALNMAATSGSAEDFARQTRAAELLLIAFGAQPDHPGAAHYLTYCLNSSRHQSMTMFRKTAPLSPTRRILLSSLATLVLFGVGAIMAVAAPPWETADAQSSTPIGGPFALVGGDGRTVTDETFRGRWMLLYFGYTHCPEICPTTLSDIAEMLEKLGPLAAELQPLFVTIDPARDTPEVIAKYAAAFDPRIVGLSGSAAAIEAAAKSYHVYYRRAANSDGDDDYFMEHSAFVYLVDNNGRYATLFAPTEGQGPDYMVSRIRDLMPEPAPASR